MSSVREGKYSMSVADARPNISAIICTYNRYNTILDTINSIEMQSLDYKDYELIIVDNTPPGEQKNNFETSLDIKCNAKYIAEDRPGLSLSRNIGTDIAEGKYVMFLDDDAVAPTNWLESALARFESDAKIAVIGGPVQPIWPCDKPEWLHEWLEGYLTIVDRGSEARDLFEGEWLAGTNIGFEKAVLQRAGGFDTTIGRTGKLLLSNEELAVSEKIRKLGYKIFYDPAVVMSHKVHLDRLDQKWFRKRACWQAVSNIMSHSSSNLVYNPDEDLRKIRSFVHQLPIRDRKLDSLFIDTAKKQIFLQQLHAIEALVSLLLQDPDSRTFS